MQELQRATHTSTSTTRRLQEIALGILSAVAMPFVITGLFRILPFATPTWVPFVAVRLVGLALWRLRCVPTAVLVGVGAGVVAYAGLLLWLFSVWSTSGP